MIESGLSFPIPVIYPLMPKGVEHKFSGALGIDGSVVIYPLMPKGVEHSKDSIKH